MAAVSLLNALASSANASSYASGSFTPAVGDLVVVLTHSVGGGTSVTREVVGSDGSTFTEVGGSVSDGAGRNLRCFVANALVAAASARTVTYTVTGDAFTGCTVIVLGVSGMAKTGATAFKQSNGQSGASNTIPTAVLAAAATAANPLLFLVGGNNGSGSHGAPSGFTELSSVTHSAPTTRTSTFAKNSAAGETSVNSGTSYNAAWTAMAVELDASASGGTPVNTASTANPAVYAHAGAAATSSVVRAPKATVSVADPGAFTHAGAAATSSVAVAPKATTSVADPASFTHTGAAATSTYEAAPVVGTGALASLIDKFNTISSAIWTIVKGDVSSDVLSENGEAVIYHNGNIDPGWPPPKSGLRSANTYTLQGSEAYGKFTPPLTTIDDWGMTTSVFAVMYDRSTSFGGVGFEWNKQGGGTLYFRVYNNFTDEWIDSDPAAALVIGFDPIFLKVREAGGTIYWETAPVLANGNPGSWNVRASRAVSALTNMTTASLLSSARLHLLHWNYHVDFDSSYYTRRASFDTINATANVSHESVASPAVYAHAAPAITQAARATFTNGLAALYAYSPALTLVRRGFASVASPAVYVFNPAATASSVISGYTSQALPVVYAAAGSPATSTVARFSNALPGGYTYLANDSRAILARMSVASPATFAMNAEAATGAVNPANTASQAIYQTVAFAATANIARGSIASPVVFGITPFAATAVRGRASVASPAAFVLTVSPATSIVTLWAGSKADPAAYGMVPFATTVRRGHVSAAEPATYLVVPFVADVETTGDVEVPYYEPPIGVPPLTDAEFLEWINDESAARTIIVETQCIDMNGNTEPLLFANRGFVTKLEDGLNAAHYDPILRGGLEFTQTLGIDLSGDQSYGDIELDNTDGALDWMFERIWLYQPIRAYIGDARWPRRDFRQIFDGAVEDIDTSSRDAVNMRLRDKLYRLEVPLHDEKIGGASPDSDRLLPVAFGDCHNITPVLEDANALRYVYHARSAEAVFEVRDNGIPIQRLTQEGAPARFTLPKQPYGRVTCSIQGDRDETDVAPYRTDVAGLVWRLCTRWGTEQAKRFTAEDMDWNNFDEFARNNPQAVALFATERMTVREACNQIAGSVGARLTMTALGRTQLVKVQIPPMGTPIAVDDSDMLAGSLRIVNRLPLVASVRLGYAKNWTVQQDTAAGLPEEHKAMFSREWFTTTVTNGSTRDLYNIWGEPEDQDNTLLINRDDAGAEAGRRLWLRSTQRHVYEFEGFSHLIFTQVGSAMRLTSKRFGLQNGKTGQVVSVGVDWINARVRIQVVI